MALAAAGEPNTAAPASAIQAEQYCIVSDGTLSAYTLIEFRYQEQPEKKYRQYWSIHCKIESGECYGAKLDLASLERGERISMFGLVAIPPGSMRVVSALGNVYTITYGFFTTFIVDLGQRKVLFRESSDRWDGVGEGACR